MKEWDDFLGKYVEGEKFEYFRYTEGEYQDLDLEPVILKTLQIMNRLEQSGNKNNVFLFPKLKPLINQLVMSIAIYDIINGNIPVHYDTCTYVQNQTLMVGNAVVRYKGQDEKSIKIETSDLDNNSIPIDCMPIFQKTDKKSLSTLDRFRKES